MALSLIWLTLQSGLVLQYQGTLDPSAQVWGVLAINILTSNIILYKQQLHWYIVEKIIFLNIAYMFLIQATVGVWGAAIGCSPGVAAGTAVSVDTCGFEHGAREL